VMEGLLTLVYLSVAQEEGGTTTVPEQAAQLPTTTLNNPTLPNPQVNPTRLSLKVKDKVKEDTGSTHRCSRLRGAGIKDSRGGMQDGEERVKGREDSQGRGRGRESTHVIEDVLLSNVGLFETLIENMEREKENGISLGQISNSLWDLEFTGGTGRSVVDVTCEDLSVRGGEGGEGDVPTGPLE
jgi:hypothetical protein